MLRAGRLSEADIAHVAEEIESMGRSEKRELVGRLTVLLLHLLKWHHQPVLSGASWRTSVRVRRISLAAHLRHNPSLKTSAAEAIADAYRIARIEAGSETGWRTMRFRRSVHGRSSRSWRRSFGRGRRDQA